jgi:hypothetical protein
MKELVSLSIDGRVSLSTAQVKLPPVEISVTGLIGPGDVLKRRPAETQWK